MIERTVHYEQDTFNLVFDRDAIVRAALRAYVEANLAWADPQTRLLPASCEVMWTGDIRCGGFYNGNGCGDYDVVAWTEAGVVGLAYELGWGPLEQLRLPVKAITRGPDDVRGAVPGLPIELESAFVMAADMLIEGAKHGEKSAGVGFWLYGEHVAGSLFEDSTAGGALRLVAWGALRDGRLPDMCDAETAAENAAENARRGAAPVEAIVDAVTARVLAGPTALTAEEIATLLPSPPDPERLHTVQRMLRRVGVSWPGIPEEPEPRS
jgi:hypothetical protein